MSMYIVTRKADGAQVYVYSAGSPIEWQGMEFATFDHVEQPEPVATVVPAPSLYGGRRDLTVLEFMRLFTPVERITIRAAGAADPRAADYLDMMYHADVVHLDDPDTQTALAMFEADGILTAARRIEVNNG